MNSARTWSALVDMEEVGLEQTYDNALCLLASMMAIEEAQAEETEEKEDDDSSEAPDISDTQELIEEVLDGKKPSWWPKRLDRMAVKIRIQPHGSTPDNIKPHPLDPNSKDLSRASFSALLKSLLELGGDPFDGVLQIQLIRLKDKALIGGWKGEVYIGEKAKKKKRGESDSGDDSNERLLEYLLDERKRDTESMQRMFANSSNVIHASASAIQALRGANMAPPWMQGGEVGEDMPFWMTLAKGAAEMVLQAGLGQQPNVPGYAGQAMGQMMQHPTQRQPAALGGPQPAPQLPGPTQDNLGYNQYMQARGGDGQYEGVSAVDDDMLDDDFENQDPWYDNDQFAESGEPFEEEYEGTDDEEDDEDYEDDEEGNPLAGMSPDEVASHLEQYIDANAHQKPALKNLGMRLAGKLMK